MDLNKYKIGEEKGNLQSISDVASSEIYFFDNEGNETTKENATRLIIRELDKDGNLINETFGTCNQKQNIEEQQKNKTR